MVQPRREVERVPSWLATSAAWMWRLLLLVLSASLFVMVTVRLALVTVPLIVALVLATLAAPPARALRRAHVPAALAAFLVVFGGFAAIVAGLAALVPSLVEQSRDLVPTVLRALEDLLAWFENGPLGIDQQELREFGEATLEQVQERGGDIATSALSVAATLLQVAASLVLALILLFFLVKDGDRIWAWFLARSSDRHQETMRAVGIRAWEALAGYVRGTALVALIDAVGIGVGLAIVGVPLVLPLAVLVFFGGFVPIVGAAVSGLVAVLVALADGGIATALIVLAIVIVVQQIESDVLQPVIMRRTVALHPIVVLAVLTSGSVLIGIVGAFLAVPVAAVLAAVANELRLRHENDDSGPEPLGGPNGRLETAQVERQGDPESDPDGDGQSASRA